MLIGLDHVVIAVADLEEATDRFKNALGLEATPGGEHPGVGTQNAIVRFGADYMELISVRDREEAGRSPRSRLVMEQIEQNGPGLLGFALAADQLDGDVSEAARRGIAMDAITAGSRRRPDGTMMHWRSARVQGDPWGRRLPFLIQHETSPRQRRDWAPASHPLGATTIPLISVGVADLEQATDDYRKLLGSPPERTEEVPALPARRTRFPVGSFRIDLLQPMADTGGLAEHVHSQGGGIFMVSLRVPDVDRAVRFLRERGTAVGNPTPRRRAPLLDPSQTLGVRLQLVETV